MTPTLRRALAPLHCLSAKSVPGLPPWFALMLSFLRTGRRRQLGHVPEISRRSGVNDHHLPNSMFDTDKEAPSVKIVVVSCCVCPCRKHLVRPSPSCATELDPDPATELAPNLVPAKQKQSHLISISSKARQHQSNSTHLGTSPATFAGLFVIRCQTRPPKGISPWLNSKIAHLGQTMVTRGKFDWLERAPAL